MIATVEGIVRVRHQRRTDGRCGGCSEPWPCATLLRLPGLTLVELERTVGKQR